MIKLLRDSSAALGVIAALSCSGAQQESAAPVQSTPPKAAGAGAVGTGVPAAAGGADAGIAGTRAAGPAPMAGAGAPPTQPSAAGTLAAGSGAAPRDAGVPPADMEDAGPTPPPGAATGVTLTAETKLGPVTLGANGASCAADRCSLPVPADGKLSVELSLEYEGGATMPVLARWTGCGEPTTTFFPVTPSSTSYIIHYMTELTGLRAGASCRAEIVPGAWLTFAGDMSVKVASGAAYCSVLQKSEMGLNATCFPPAGTAVEIASDLARWDCVIVGADGKVEDKAYTQQPLRVIAAEGQLLSCIGAAR